MCLGATQSASISAPLLWTPNLELIKNVNWIKTFAANKFLNSDRLGDGYKLVWIMSIQSRTDLYKNSGINWSNEIKITKIVITSIKGSGKSPVGSKCVNMASDGFRHVRRHALLYTQVLDPLLHLKVFTKKDKPKRLTDVEHFNKWK
jgi:hypothetical protein